MAIRRSLFLGESAKRRNSARPRLERIAIITVQQAPPGHKSEPVRAFRVPGRCGAVGLRLRRHGGQCLLPLRSAHATRPLCGFHLLPRKARNVSKLPARIKNHPARATKSPSGMLHFQLFYAITPSPRETSVMKSCTLVTIVVAERLPRSSSLLTTNSSASTA